MPGRQAWPPWQGGCHDCATLVRAVQKDVPSRARRLEIPSLPLHSLRLVCGPSPARMGRNRSEDVPVSPRTNDATSPPATSKTKPEPTRTEPRGVMAVVCDVERQVAECVRSAVLRAVTLREHELDEEMSLLRSLLQDAMDGQEELARNHEARLLELADLAAHLVVAEQRRASRWEKRALRLRNRSESSVCVVCLERRRRVVILPCWHLVLCTECCGQMANNAKCPICRQNAEDVQVVYMP